MKSPFFSVIIPTRHRDELLARCLDQLAPGQQIGFHREYEVIITDDGDRGTTQALLAERYPWTRYTAGPRRGPAANRNNGARQGCGEFLIFVDDDCVPQPQWLSAFADAIRDSVDLYEGKTTCSTGLKSALYEAPINLAGGSLWSCNLMVRATNFWQLGAFDEDFPFATMEDIAFRDRASLAGTQNVFVPCAVVDHPARPTALGFKIAPLHESHAIFWAKYPEHSRSTFRHMQVFLKQRLKNIFNYPLSIDSVLALRSLFAEQALIFWRLKSWKRKYRELIQPRSHNAIARASRS